MLKAIKRFSHSYTQKTNSIVQIQRREDLRNGLIYFTGIYPFTPQSGSLIHVKQGSNMFKFKNNQVRLFINSRTPTDIEEEYKNNLIIRSMNLKEYECKKSRNLNMRKPWSCNTVWQWCDDDNTPAKPLSTCMNTVYSFHEENVRGGNRICITLNYPGEYNIYAPFQVQNLNIDAANNMNITSHSKF